MTFLSSLRIAFIVYVRIVYISYCSLALTKGYCQQSEMCSLLKVVREEEKKSGESIDQLFCLECNNHKICSSDFYFHKAFLPVVVVNQSYLIK